MNASDVPSRFPIPFADGATGSYKRTVPTTSADPAAASLTLGYPPDTFVDPDAGGTPPDGRDMNGILNQLSAWSRWQAAGGPVIYNSAFSTAIGGYPLGAILTSTTPGLFWLSTADGNTTDPDGGSPANWTAVNPIRASSGDMTAGTNNTRFVTPALLSGLFGAATNYMVYPNGVIEQWGYVSFPSTGSPVVGASLVVPYSGTSYNISLTPSINSATGLLDSFVQAIQSSKSTTGFSVQYQNGVTSSPGLDGFEWRTIGR